MTEIEFIKKLAQDNNCSEIEAQNQLEGIIKGLQEVLLKGDELTLRGFGRFYVARKQARIGYDPKRKIKINIEAKSTPVFKAGNTLKLKVNSALKES